LKSWKKDIIMDEGEEKVGGNKSRRESMMLTRTERDERMEEKVHTNDP
jgi:hypothetical protein